MHQRTDMKGSHFSNGCSILTFNYNIKTLLHLFSVPFGQHRTLLTEYSEDFRKISFIASININILTSKKQKLCNTVTTLTYSWNALFEWFIVFAYPILGLSSFPYFCYTLPLRSTETYLKVAWKITLEI